MEISSHRRTGSAVVGDILDPLHSTKWLFPAPGNEDLPRITEPGEQDYIRPWSEPNDPRFAAKLKEVTSSILDYNKEGLDVFRKLANGEFIEFDATDGDGGRVVNSAAKIPLRVRFHYMVGNHDWYYHLKGEAFDQIRQEIIDALGLCNPPTPFPYDLRKSDPTYSWKVDEYPEIERLFRDYKVFVRHGDCYDTFNFDAEKGRDYPQDVPMEVARIGTAQTPSQPQPKIVTSFVTSPTSALRWPPLGSPPSSR
jgi:hypothetical protein